MSDEFILKILAADRALYEGSAKSLIFPASDGYFQVLANHENMIIACEEGEIRVTVSEGDEKVAKIGEGFVKIISNSVIMVVETAEWK